MLGLDLDDAAITDLGEARRDRIAEKRGDYAAINASLTLPSEGIAAQYKF